MNIEQQSRIYRNQLASRKRNPVKPATLAAYDSYFRSWILPKLGCMNLRKVENGVMRTFVAELAAEGLSASTIAGIQLCLKNIISSCIDMNGNELYPRKWNNDYIDAPQIDPRGQKAPVITQLELNRAISTASGCIRPLIVLMAASGLRVSEALALKHSVDQESSYIDRDRRVLVIRKALYDGQEQSTKTQAGVREVDVIDSVLDTIPQQPTGFVFTNSQNKPFVSTSSLLRDGLEKIGVPGFHSLRRFRITHLESTGVPRGLIQFWAGHSTNTNITDRYVKVASDIELRKTWAIKAGLGFQI